MTALTGDLLLRAYAMGVFPMAEHREAEEIAWIDPNRRGIFPLERFHISRSLRKTLMRNDYSVRLNHDFEACVRACADRTETWINAEILRAYVDLHARGYAHSLEIWRGERLAGAVYGVTLGAAFFGESMVSPQRDGSKMALAWLIARLRYGGFTLFDTQFTTPHLTSLGAVEISRAAYHQRLTAALHLPASIAALPNDATAREVFG